MSMKSSDFKKAKKYTDGLTKQAFKDSCDVNKILKRAAKAGSISHLQKYPAAEYGEFENYDLLEAHRRLKRANEIFEDLPAEVKREFDQDALAFAGFCSNPENRERLGELIPAIALPGQFFPNPVKRTDVPTTEYVEAHKRAHEPPESSPPVDTEAKPTAP